MSDPQKLRDEIFSRLPGLFLVEKLFERLEDAAFCVKNRNRQYVAVNMACVKRMGAPNKASVLGRTARDFFPPLLFAGYDRQDDFVFSTGGEIHDLLEMNTNRDGTIGWYLCQKFPLHDDRQNVIAVTGVSIDLKTPAGEDPRLSALAGVIDQIQRDYAKPLRMEELARNAQMSPDRLKRAMRAVFKLSPRQFLTKTRIEAAASTLQKGRDSIAKVAAECGFYDQTLFCKQFREATGMTPSQYREANTDRTGQFSPARQRITQG